MASSDNFIQRAKQPRKTVDIPENNRESVEPAADMSPDDARQFVMDLMSAVYTRMREMPDDDFEKPDGQSHLPPMERAKQYYGTEMMQLLSGIEAALRTWDADHPQDVEELKEKYQGTFVEGVEIGHRLAVYQGSDFAFSAGDGSPSVSEKFTFST